MKKLLWTSAIALTAVACLTACDESTSGASNAIASYKTETALPDTCEMEVAKAGDTYFACFENKWVEVTDSATVEQFKEGLDEDEIKGKLEELEDLLKPTTPAKPKSSSSKKTDEDVESSDSEEPESSASEEECTGRRCKTDNSSSSKKSNGGNGGSSEGDEGGEGSSPSSAESSSPSSTESSSPSSAESSSPSSTESSSPSSAESSSPSSTESSSPSSANSSVSKCGGVVYDPETQSCVGTVIKDKCGDNLYTHQQNWACVDENYYYIDPTDEDFVYVVDKRDGNAYRVLMGPDKVVWMAENLRYDNGSTRCYSGDNSECSLYGRAYTWTDAAGSICPDGWHTASGDEWINLVSAAGTTTKESLQNLRSTSGWREGYNGNDEFGFNMLEINFRDNSSGSRISGAYFWSSDEVGTAYGNNVTIYEDFNWNGADGGDSKTRYASVRCVMDDATLPKLAKALD
ncbi:MAG: hypothetical protein IKB43_07730 [Fibrobacter sp.]|nr:hypothetical protein [Fibrobacter sp.]MBR2470021.1 hypothetical protein [Fibrobacter sp.]